MLWFPQPHHINAHGPVAGAKTVNDRPAAFRAFPKTTDWLKRNGFSYKKNEPFSAKADPVEQADFVEKYRELKAGLIEGESIRFVDASHPTRTTKIIYSWPLKKAFAKRSKPTRETILGSCDVGLNDDFS